MGGAIIFIARKLDDEELKNSLSVMLAAMLAINRTIGKVSEELKNIKDITGRDYEQTIHERDVAIRDLVDKCDALESKLKAADVELQENKVTIESQLKEIESLNRALNFYVERF